MASKTQKGKNTTQIAAGSGKKNTKNKKIANNEKKIQNNEPSRIQSYPEVKILISFALAVFLMLCNFHLCSVLGNVFFNIMHGLFGFLAYIFPILLFIAYSFLLSNAGRKDAHTKVLLGFFIFWDLCSIIELAGVSGKTAFNPIHYFKQGLSGFNGGLIGGIVGGGLSHIVGKIAAFLFLSILLLILVILITERNLTKTVIKVFEQVNESLKERQRLRLEEKDDPEYEDDDIPYDYVEDNYSETSYADDSGPVRQSYSGDAHIETEFKEPSYAFHSLKDQDNESPENDAAKTAAEEADAENSFSRKEGRERKLFNVSLDGINKLKKREDNGSKLNSFFNTRMPFKKEKTVEADYIQLSSVKQNNREGTETKPDGMNGRSFVRSTKIYLPKKNLTLKEMGLSEFLPDEPQDETNELVTINDFIVYNSIKEWKEDDPFVMPLDHFPDEEEPVHSGPTLVKGPSAEVVSAESWQNEHPSDAKIYELKRNNDISAYSDDLPEYDDTAEEDFDEEPSFSDYASETSNPAPEQYKAEETGEGDFVFPVESGQYGSETKADEDAVDLTENVVLPENGFPEPEKGNAPGNRKKTNTDSIWRTQDDFSNRSDSGAVTFSKPKKPEPVKKVKKAYVKAPLNLLSSNGEFKLGIDKHQIETQKKLYNTLESFGVHVKMGAISVGPAVTRYELEPEVGVKVSRIVGLQDDIKLALAAADVRIEAPIPGKSAVGIEVPNAKSTTVGFRELIDTEKFRSHPSKLCVAIGRDLAGQIQLADLAKMPHLLIAGATGSGKSVCINTLIMSILYKATPDEVKLIMVDPKVVELSAYNGIPHLLIPVVTDPRKASNALRWAVDEMDDRYKRLAEYKVRNIQGYNDEIKKRKKADPSFEGELMYQMVIIVDELADLMMVAPGEVEESICRLAQKARAAGIHLVLATQRPSVNVITGLIKANVPSRIAFAVSSGVDSRTILDMNGAEKLLGRGDMLYYPYGLQKPIRVQGAFISDEDVSRVVEYIVTHNMDSKSGKEQMEDMITSASAAQELKPVTDGRDEHFADAARFIIESDKASIGALQRKFRIGFNRAARLMDALADEGIVGEDEGTKPRKILMNMEELENYLSTNS